MGGGRIMSPGLGAASVELRRGRLRIFSTMVHSFKLAHGRTFTCTVARFVTSTVSKCTYKHTRTFNSAGFRRSTTSRHSTFLGSLPLSSRLHSCLSNLAGCRFLGEVKIRWYCE